MIACGVVPAFDTLPLLPFSCAVNPQTRHKMASMLVPIKAVVLLATGRASG